MVDHDTNNHLLYFTNIYNQLYMCNSCHTLFIGSESTNLRTHLFERHKLTKEELERGEISAKILKENWEPPEIEDIHPVRVEGIKPVSGASSTPSASNSSAPPIPGTVSVKETKIIEPPETVEALLKEENQLLKEIVKQNQKVLSKTEEILKQNQQLIEMLIQERNMKSFDFSEDSDWDDDPPDVKLEDEQVRGDFSEFLSQEADETNPFRKYVATEEENEIEIPDFFQVKEEGVTNDEEDVEMITEEEKEENQAYKDSALLELQPRTSKESQKKSIEMKNNSNFPINTIPLINLQLRVFSSTANVSTQMIINLPITTLSKLAEIDELMKGNEHIKRTVSDYLMQITSENIQYILITPEVFDQKLIKDIVTGDGWKESLFLKAAKIPGYQVYKQDRGIWKYFYRSTTGKSACCRFKGEDGKVCGKILILDKARHLTSLYKHVKEIHKV